MEVDNKEQEKQTDNNPEQVQPVEGSAYNAKSKASDESLRQGDLAATKANKNLLYGRYEIDLEQPLDDSSKLKATEFAAKDREGQHTNIYAVILDNNLPYRLKAIYTYEKLRSPNLQRMVAHGTVFISSLGEVRYVLIFEKIAGKKFSDILSQTKSWSERKTIQEFIQPMHSILEILSAHEVTIGQLNTDTVYYDNGRIIIKEFVSRPTGYNQNHHFETLERLSCNALSKGEGDVSVDYFALGVMLIHMGLGFTPNTEFEPDNLISKRMTMGSYNTEMGSHELSANIEDAIRGLVNDNIYERWGSQQIDTWLSGKRYNIIRPSQPKESSRSYTFGKDQLFNQRALGYAMFKNWQEARSDLRDFKLIRWVQLSIQKPEKAEELKRVLVSTGGEFGRSPSEDDELIARSLIILDNPSPIRFRNLGVNVDGLGTVIADAYAYNKSDVISLVRRIIDLDLINFWYEFNPNPVGYEIESIVSNIDKIRVVLKTHTLGFGLERVMYDLNPSLTCQSDLVKKDHVLTIEDLILSLDSKSKDVHKQTDPLDTHIAAFICSKLGIQGEVKLPSLDKYPTFRDSKLIGALILLNKAQKKSGIQSARNICQWLYEKYSKIIESYHSRSIRKQVNEDLRKSISNGSIEGMLKIITNVDTLEADRTGFDKACAQFQKNSLKINKLRNNKEIKTRATKIAMRVSMLISYAVAIGAFISLMQDFKLNI